MNRFQRFMYNKYGMDELNVTLLWTGVVLSILSIFVPNMIIKMIMSYTPIICCIFRMMSKNYSARRKENDKYLQMVYPYKKKIKKIKARRKNGKIYKYFKCPNCKQEMRVPKHKGNIEVTCPRCKVHFDAKS